MRTFFSSICALIFAMVLFLFPAVSLLAGPAVQGKLLLVGDSLGAGYGVEPGKEWAAILQQKFQQADMDITVANASISGDTTAGGASRIQTLLEREQPQWVLIELGGNDGLRGMSLKAMADNLQMMVTAVKSAAAEPLLLGIKVPPNYGRKYAERFEQVFSRVAQENKIPLLPFLLEGVGGEDRFMQADRIHPNEFAQPIIAELVWQFLRPQLTASKH
ncbi:arylesterase [Ketobacter nezhaii]|uniref:arylesterase n=1 Tax=Ketobacter sp. MCCC 1A13808 TaxID=2602738 RepID=UPI001E282D17|nr:arylesterase [Ketobacter sp. MCCC 1A13808]